MLNAGGTGEGFQVKASHCFSLPFISYHLKLEISRFFFLQMKPANGECALMYHLHDDTMLYGDKVHQAKYYCDYAVPHIQYTIKDFVFLLVSICQF